MRQGLQLEMRFEMDDLIGRMLSARLRHADSAVPVRRGRLRPRSSFGSLLETRLKKVNELIDELFPGSVAAYTEEMGLRK